MDARTDSNNLHEIITLLINKNSPKILKFSMLIQLLILNRNSESVYTVGEANPDSLITMHSTIRESGLAFPTVYTKKSGIVFQHRFSPFFYTFRCPMECHASISSISWSTHVPSNGFWTVNNGFAVSISKTFWQQIRPCIWRKTTPIKRLFKCAITDFG